MKLISKCLDVIIFTFHFFSYINLSASFEFAIRKIIMMPFFVFANSAEKVTVWFNYSVFNTPQEAF